MQNLFISAGLFLWVVLATYAAGACLLVPLCLTWSSGVQRFVFAGALGLGLWLVLLFFAGWLLAYTRAIALGVTIVITIPALWHAKNIWGQGFRLQNFRDQLEADSLAWVLAGFCCVCLALSLASGFAPVADMADVLAYHLNLPKEWVRTGHISTFACDINSAFPLLVNVGFGFGLLFKTTAFANLLSVWIGTLCAIGVYGWARDQVSAKYAFLAAATFLLSPAVYNHLNTPYVDLTLVLYSFLSFWSFCAWVKTDRAAWIGLSGIFCGLALSVKYLALIYALAIGIGILVEAKRKSLGFSRCMRLAALFGFLALAVCVVWYARSYAVMGNPVYPYYGKYFGGKPSLIAWHSANRNHGRGFGLLNLLTLFWDATYYPVAYAGFGTRWNLLFLGLLPFVIWFVLRKKGGWLVFFAAVILLSWFFLFQLMRYLMPFFALYCVLLAWALAFFFSENSSIALRRLVWTWVLAVCLWETACIAVHAKPQIRAGLSTQAAEQYLLEKESTYAMARWVNKNLPSDARILSDGEQRFFYFEPAMVREEALRLFVPYPEAMKSPQETIEYLRREGFTHVLIGDYDADSGKFDALAEANPGMVRNFINCPALFELLHETSYASPAKKIHYRIYRIL